MCKTSVFGKCSVHPPTTRIRSFSIQNCSSRLDQVPDQRLPKALLITPRQDDMEIRLYCMLFCVGNGKVITRGVLIRVIIGNCYFTMMMVNANQDNNG